MRPYRHYCGIARALDVVGDRWSLLIVRELLAGPARYVEILDGLPGIATNLLAERLRSLLAAGVLSRDDDGRYCLTPWGEQLAVPLYALAQWGAPLMGKMDEDESFRPGWLVHPVRVMFSERDADRPPCIIEVRVDGTPMTIESVDGEVVVRRGSPARPDLVVNGPPDAILGLLSGQLDPAAAEELGAHLLGDSALLGALRPQLAVAKTVVGG